MNSFQHLLTKYQEIIQYNTNPNNTHKATVNINVKNFSINKFKNSVEEMIHLISLIGNNIKDNNKKYNNLGTIVVDLKNVTKNNFSMSYFKKIYKVIDKNFYKEDIVDKIICFCNSSVPIIIWKLVKPIIDPDTVKKFIFYKV